MSNDGMPQYRTDTRYARSLGVAASGMKITLAHISAVLSDDVSAELGTAVLKSLQADLKKWLGIMEAIEAEPNPEVMPANWRCYCGDTSYPHFMGRTGHNRTQEEWCSVGTGNKHCSHWYDVEAFCCSCKRNNPAGQS